MFAALFTLWIIGAIKSVIDDYELTFMLGFADWAMIFGVAALWPIVDTVYFINKLRKYY